MKKGSRDLYFDTVADITGSRGDLYRITDEGEAPAVEVVIYQDVLERGHTTAFSYGLSSVPHREWVNSRPELILSVNSADTSWGLCMGEIIRLERDRSSFAYGTIFNFGESVAEDSPMTSFLVFACSVLAGEELSIDLPDRKIHWSQLYPLHHEEVAIVRSIGPEKFFFEFDIDFTDVYRKPYRFS